VGRENPSELKAAKLARSMARGVEDRDLKPNTKERQQIEAVIVAPPNRHGSSLAAFHQPLMSIARAHQPAEPCMQALGACSSWSPTVPLIRVDMANCLSLSEPLQFKYRSGAKFCVMKNLAMLICHSWLCCHRYQNAVSSLWEAALCVHRPLTAEERALVWRFRWSLTGEPRALTKVLRCVDWGDAREARSAGDLIARWAPIGLADALELLSPAFSNPEVHPFFP